MKRSLPPECPSASTPRTERARRPRRTDPERRARLIATTLTVIAEHGVAGTTFRRISEAADVSLGSLTYHFTSMDALLEAAFTQLATQIGQRFDQMLAGASGREEAEQAVVDIIFGEVWSSPHTLLLSFELYAYAARSPQRQGLLRNWMRLSRTALERHFDTRTARALDALIEGLGIHGSFDRDKLPRSEIERLVRLIANG